MLKPLVQQGYRPGAQPRGLADTADPDEVMTALYQDMDSQCSLDAAARTSGLASSLDARQLAVVSLLYRFVPA